MRFWSVFIPMLYFAYGSNMLSSRLLARVPQAECLGAALLPGYELCCDKRSVDGSGKFTIIEAATAEVPGVLYQIDVAGRRVLDEFEGPGYRARRLVMHKAAASLTALVYQALPDWRAEALQPYDWYLAYAIAGAREHDLPVAHQQRLAAWPSQVDENSKRAALNRAIAAGESPALEEQQNWPC